MAKPWEKYATESAAKPWEKYGQESAELSPREQFIQSQQPDTPQNYPMAESADTSVLGSMGKAELPRLVAEAVTFPLNVLKKSAAGYGGLASMGSNLLSGGNIDTALQAGAQRMQELTPIQSPLQPSKIGGRIGSLIEQGTEAAEKATGNTGFAKAGIEAAMDIAGLVGGVKAAPRVARAAADVTYRPVISRIAESSIPEQLYGSAVKLPLSAKWKKTLNAEEVTKRQDAINAGLSQEIIPNELGVAKSKQLLEQAAEKTREVISGMDEMGNILPKSRLKQGTVKAQALSELEGDTAAQKLVNKLYDKRFNNMGVVRQGDVAIDPFGTPVATLDLFYKPSEMQTIKQHLQRMSDYERTQLSRSLTSQIKELTNKDMAHEALVMLEELNPELKALNRNTQAYISLVEGIESAAGRIANVNPISLGSKVLAAGNMGLAILNQVVGMPSVKSKIAFALNRARKNPAQIKVGDLRQQIIPPEPRPMIPPGGTADLDAANWSPRLPTIPPAPVQRTRTPINIPTAEVTPRNQMSLQGLGTSVYRRGR